jgi:hypothetical protein
MRIMREEMRGEYRRISSDQIFQGNTAEKLMELW